jgi:hypothetical protein
MVHKKDTTVAAPKQFDHPSVMTLQIQALKRDAVRRVQDGPERDLLVEALEGVRMSDVVRIYRPDLVPENAEEGRLPVVGAEAAEKPGNSDKASPALADRGRAREGGWLRQETDEDLPEHISSLKGSESGAAGEVPRRRRMRRVTPAPSSVP